MAALTAAVVRALVVGVPRSEGGNRTDVVVVNAAAAVTIFVAILLRMNAELQLGLLEQVLVAAADRH